MLPAQDAKAGRQAQPPETARADYDDWLDREEDSRLANEAHREVFAGLPEPWGQQASLFDVSVPPADAEGA